MAASSREPIKIIVDSTKPADLSPDQRLVLHRFFLEKEKQAEHGKTEPFKGSYPFQVKVNREGKEVEEKYTIEFAQPLFRRRKHYRAVKQCDATHPLPALNRREKNVLYLQKEPDGQMGVYTREQLQPVKLLTNEQWQSIHSRWVSIDRQTDARDPYPIPAGQAKMAVLMSICGYPVDRHLYQSEEASLGKGGHGQVSESSGKWEHSGTEMVFVSYSEEHSRKQARVHLMKTPEGSPPVYEISDNDTIYLYKTWDGDVFHRIAGNDENIIDSSHTDEYRLDFSKQIFDGRELEKEQLKNALLEMISARDELAFSERSVRRQTKAIKIEDISPREGDVVRGEPDSNEQEERAKRWRLHKVRHENKTSGELDEKTWRVKPVVTHGTTAYSLMPKYEGVNLRTFLLEQGNKLTDEQRYSISLKLIEAVNKMHQKGKVHRDLKPENVMISPDMNTITIIDPGEVADENEPAAYTGTPWYIPPEVSAIADELTAEKSHDLYSLGVMLREVCQDDIFEGKKNAVSAPGITRDYQSLEYYLNISMSDVNSVWLQGGVQLTQDQKVWLSLAMNSLTRTAANERPSTDDLLKLKDSKQPKLTPPVTLEKNLDLEKATECFNGLAEAQRAYFLGEVKNQFDKLKYEVIKGGSDKRKDIVMAFDHVLRTAEKENKFYAKNKACDQNGLYPDAENSLKLILIMSQFLREAEKQTPNLAGMEKQHKALKDCLSSYGMFVRKAWNETFQPQTSREGRLKKTTRDHVLNFIGLPDAEKITGRTIAAWVLLGFVLTPVRNIIKLPEFALKWLSESFAYFSYKNSQAHPVSGAGKALETLVAGALYVAHGVTEGVRLLVRTVTSPVTSFREAWRESPFLGVLSAACSIGALAGVIVFALPVVTPVVLDWVVAQLPAMAKPTAALLTQIGLIALPAIPVLFNEWREKRLEEKPAGKKPGESVDKSTAKSLKKTDVRDITADSTHRPVPLRAASPSFSSTMKSTASRLAASNGRDNAVAILNSVSSSSEQPGSVHRSVDSASSVDNNDRRRSESKDEPPAPAVNASAHAENERPDLSSVPRRPSRSS
ncbi:MAG TPA: protein kinase [Gammaproteobacteria bacterium]|nr:protein kinase [Gammaproteobacteria bacterium]